MYPGKHASLHPERPAVVMAGSRRQLTYAQLDERSYRLAHFLREQGLRRLDHYAMFMENTLEFIETCAAGERTGLYYTCINSYLRRPRLGRRSAPYARATGMLSQHVV